jgi:hypothetical protein
VVKEVAAYRGSRRVLCVCDCGEEVVVIYKSVRTGNTKSCGCLRREIVSAKNFKHGMKHLPEYTHWRAMRQRCNDPNCEKYAAYGAVGVTVCSRWNDFPTFLSDVGRMPSPKHTLDRFPNRHGNYEVGNVRWATPSEQVRNRSCTRTVLVSGKTVPIIELAERYGLDPGRVAWRLDHGWTLEESLTIVPKKGRNGYDRK